MDIENVKQRLTLPAFNNQKEIAANGYKYTICLEKFKSQQFLKHLHTLHYTYLILSPNEINLSLYVSVSSFAHVVRRRPCDAEGRTKNKGQSFG